MQELFQARHFPDYVDQMLGFLTSHGKDLDPGDRGTALYFVGIAAFACHDYQSATCFFDAAASEDFKVQNVIGRGRREILLWREVRDDRKSTNDRQQHNECCRDAAHRQPHRFAK